jgi:hypothetical protein
MDPEGQARQIKRWVEEIIEFSEQCPPPEDYYREFLKRVLLALGRFGFEILRAIFFFNTR